MKWFWKCLKQYADFSGRARRKEYWWFVLINAIITLLLVVGMMVPMFKLAFSAQAGEVDEWDIMRVILTCPFTYIYIVYYMAMLVPSVAVLVRRLHDIGKSGYWAFLVFGGSILSSISNLFSESNTVVYLIIALPCMAIGILALVWMFTDSQYGPNKYGPNPKGEGNDEAPVEE